MSQARAMSQWNIAPRGGGAPRASVARRPRVWLALVGGLVVLAGCGKGVAGGLAPDFAGLWDVTYADALRVEVRLGDSRQSTRLEALGGSVSLRDAGVQLDFEVDCTRPELVCPSEVWPRELALTTAPGQLDREGAQLAQPIAGVGQGRCTALAGSFITSEVMSIATAHSIRPDAVALTGGRIRVVLDAACVAPHAGLPAGVTVVLTTDFTSAKR